MAFKKREKTDKILYTGFFTGKVIAINPTAAQRAEIIGYDLADDAEEPAYEGKNKDGEEYVSINFLMEADAPNNGKFFDARFRITDKVQVNKDGSKTQFVNQTGGSSWADKKENLLDWFTHYQKEESKGSGKYINVADKEVRAAIQGEAGLYTFLRAWLSDVDWYSVDTNLFSMVDVKKMFRNLDKFLNDEYRPLLKLTGEESLTKSVTCLATVYTGEKDGNIVHYQQMYNEYLPEYMMKKISFALSSNNWTDKAIKKYYDQLTGEYGSKDAYTLGMLQPFSAENHLQATNETFKQAAETADPTDISY